MKKLLIAATLAASAIFASATTASAAGRIGMSESDWAIYEARNHKWCVRHDVNFDDVIDVTDMSELSSFILTGKSSLIFGAVPDESGDINNDGVLNATDVILLKKTVSKYETVEEQVEKYIGQNPAVTTTAVTTTAVTTTAVETTAVTTTPVETTAVTTTPVETTTVATTTTAVEPPLVLVSSYDEILKDLETYGTKDIYEVKSNSCAGEEFDAAVKEIYSRYQGMPLRGHSFAINKVTYATVTGSKMNTSLDRMQHAKTTWDVESFTYMWIYSGRCRYAAVITSKTSVEIEHHPYGTCDIISEPVYTSEIAYDSDDNVECRSFALGLHAALHEEKDFEMLVNYANEYNEGVKNGTITGPNYRADSIM